MYHTEIYKLAVGLTARNIPFDLHPLWGGWQITADDWDAICHEYSYGGREGLLEIMGLVDDEICDDVEGWLTAENVFARIYTDFMSK